MHYEEQTALLALYGEDEEAKLQRAATLNADRMTVNCSLFLFSVLLSVLQAIKDAAVATLSSSIFFHVAIVLFGAPIIE